MQIKAVIFDMDGLLIDSEPLWQEAGKETLLGLGYTLTTEQYHTSTGLRTEEWIAHWFHHFQIDQSLASDAISTILQKAIENIRERGSMFHGAEDIIQLCRKEGLKIGLATSSPMEVVDAALNKFSLTDRFDIISSAGNLPYGKPHPQVYLQCAEKLSVSPLECVAFEDSFNGMIAAKAARMKCIVVPSASDYDHPKWAAADLKLKSLSEFNWSQLL
jgi:HAD superfamily hydrolase (TIGR01509 family)